MLDPERALGLLAAEGQRTADAVVGRLAESVPFCPGWTGRDLTVHLAGVYRWVSAVIVGAMPEPPDRESRASLFTDPDPGDDAGVIARLREAHAQVLSAFRTAPPDLQCWTIWPGGPAREFWIRRQLHESVVHRVDSENLGRTEATAAGGEELETELAADGVDEMVLGFSGRYAKRLRHPSPATLALHATDATRDWWIDLGPEEPVTGRGVAPGATTEVRGRAGELLLLLWNRRLASGLSFTGDESVLSTWREHAHL